MMTKVESRYVPALGYRWLTPAYDFTVRYLTRERTFKQGLIEQAAVTPGQSVLDLACGTGTLAIWIKQRYPDVDIRGLDGDAQILSIATEKARKAGTDVHFVHGLSVDLPFADRKFDRVVSSLFFHHLNSADKLSTAQELYRVIRPGGELHIADWGRAGNTLMRLAFIPVRILDGFDNTRDSVEGQLPRLLSAGGFIDVSESKRYSTPLGTVSLYRATRPEPDGC
jgi:SAM-dependent methyltransferase